MAQLEIDFTRGSQLRLLERVQFGREMHGARPVSGTALKATLRGIDDCLGSKPAWTIPMARLQHQANLAKATVSAAVAVLARMSVLDITDRFAEVDGQAVRLPSTFRICWANVAEFVPDDSAKITETNRTPKIIEIDRETTGLTVRPGWSHSETGVVSQWDGGGLTVRPGSSHSETVSAPVRPLPDQIPPTSAPPVSRGKVFGTWFNNETLTQAVAKVDLKPIQRAFAETALPSRPQQSAGVADDLRAFAATCFDLRDAKSPVGVLAYRVRESAITREAVSESAWKWAGKLLGQTPSNQPTLPADCWLCATRGHHEPTCDVCGTKPHSALVRGSRAGERQVAHG